MPKISIIIPVYNVKKYLSRALDSLLNQTLQDFEAICVDDYSTDGSLTILRQYAEKDSRIKVFDSPQNQGPGVARNRALELAQGDYIMFLDPDDWFEPYTCEEAYDLITAHDSDVAFFNLYSYSEYSGCGTIDNHRLRPFFGYAEKKGVRLKEFKTPVITTAEVWYKIYKRSLIQEHNIRFAEVRFGEDCYFSINVLLHADTIAVTTKCLYNYTSARKGSASSGKDLRDFDLYISEKERILKMLEDNAQYHWMLKSYVPYYVASLIHYYNKFTKGTNHSKRKLYNIIRNRFAELNQKYPPEKFVTTPQANKFFVNTVQNSYFMSKIKRLFHK